MDSISSRLEGETPALALRRLAFGRLAQTRTLVPRPISNPLLGFPLRPCHSEYSRMPSLTSGVSYMRCHLASVMVTVDIARQRGAQGQEGEGRARIRR